MWVLAIALVAATAQAQVADSVAVRHALRDSVFEELRRDRNAVAGYTVWPADEGTRPELESIAQLLGARAMPVDSVRPPCGRDVSTARPHGYRVAFTISSIARDTAVAGFVASCSERPEGTRARGFAWGVTYKLRKTGDVWRIVQLIDRFIT
jgi:hypothetical protein